MDYADKLILKGRNDVYHNADYTHKCRCCGKCFDEYKKQTENMDVKEFEQLFGEEELDASSHKNGKITKVYHGPWRDFLVTETGIWTTIECPICGYNECWTVGDGNERF